MAHDEPESGQTTFDRSGLKIRQITTRADLNAAEAANIAQAMARYLTVRPHRRLAPFDYSWTLRLHRQMFGKVWKWAGVARTENLNLGVPWHRIPGDLQALLDDLDSWSGFGIDLIEQGARLHYRAVAIHPFHNGNGRWSRLLANIWLRLHGAPLVVWPIASGGDANLIRVEYLQAIRAADGGDYDPIIALHRRFSSTGDTTAL
jgi:Fic-DOC domain mobile mystery protein B